MSTAQKILVVVIFVFAVLFTGLSLSMLAHEQKWKDQYNDLKEETTKKIGDLNKNIGELDDKIKNLHDANVLKVSENQALTEKKSGLEDQLVDEGSKLAQANQNLKSLTENDTLLRQQLEDITSDLADERRKHAAEKKRAEDLVNIYQFKQDELADVIGELNGLRDRYRSLEVSHKKVEEEARNYRMALNEIEFVHGIPVNEILGSKPQPDKPIEGRVVAVAENKETSAAQLVMLSVGRNEGVKEGFEFILFDGETYLAKAVVDKVFDDMATASVVKESIAKDEKGKPLKIKQYASASTNVY